MLSIQLKIHHNLTLPGSNLTENCLHIQSVDNVFDTFLTSHVVSPNCVANHQHVVYGGRAVQCGINDWLDESNIIQHCSMGYSRKNPHPLTDGTLEILTGWGVEGSGNPGRRGGLDLKFFFGGHFHLDLLDL